MKVKYSNSLIIVLLILFSTMGCKKYPEGGSFGFLSTKKKLTGTWELTDLRLNGVSFLVQRVKLGIPPCSEVIESDVTIVSIKITFNADGTLYLDELFNIRNLDLFTFNFTTCARNYFSNGGIIRDDGKWYLNQDKTLLDISYNTLAFGGIRTSRIQKITNKELILESVDAGGTSRIYMKKVK